MKIMISRRACLLLGLLLSACLPRGVAFKIKIGQKRICTKHDLEVMDDLVQGFGFSRISYKKDGKDSKWQEDDLQCVSLFERRDGVYFGIEATLLKASGALEVVFVERADQLSERGSYTLNLLRSVIEERFGDYGVELKKLAA